MTTFKRNAQLVLSQLVENKEGQIITKVPCKIQLPARFPEVGLGKIGIDTFAYGLFPVILDGGEYAVCNVNALVELNPYKTITVTIDEVEYYEFYFDANQVMIKSTDLLVNGGIVYNIIDELVFKGKVPWYVDYEDLGKILDTAKEHAGSDAGQNSETVEFIAALVTRTKDDRTKYVRLSAKSYADTSLSNIEYVPLKSVFFSVNSTTNKLAGSYFSDGVISALVNPNDNVSDVETILRS